MNLAIVLATADQQKLVELLLGMGTLLGSSNTLLLNIEIDNYLEFVLRKNTY